MARVVVRPGGFGADPAKQHLVVEMTDRAPSLLTVPGACKGVSGVKGFDLTADLFVISCDVRRKMVGVPSPDRKTVRWDRGSPTW